MKKFNSKIETSEPVSNHASSVNFTSSKRGRSDTTGKKRTRPWHFLISKKGCCSRRYISQDTVWREEPLRKHHDSYSMKSGQLPGMTPLDYPQDLRNNYNSANVCCNSHKNSAILIDQELIEVFPPKEITFDEKWYSWSQAVCRNTDSSSFYAHNSCYLTDDETSPVHDNSIALEVIPRAEPNKHQNESQTGTHLEQGAISSHFKTLQVPQLDPISLSNSDTIDDSAFKVTLPSSMGPTINDKTLEDTNLSVVHIYSGSKSSTSRSSGVDHGLVVTWNRLAERRKSRLFRMERKRRKMKKVIFTSFLLLTTLCILTLFGLILEKARYYFKVRNDLEKGIKNSTYNEVFGIYRSADVGNYFDKCVNSKFTYCEVAKH